MDELELKKTLLNGKKEERIIFAVTPELKDAVIKLAEERCTNVSALIVSLLVDQVVENRQSLGFGE